MIIALTLAKSGFYGGNPEAVLNSRVDLVVQAYHYEMFLRQLETTFTELNNKEK